MIHQSVAISCLRLLLFLLCVCSLDDKNKLTKMHSWLKTPIEWTGEHKSILLADNNTQPIPDLTLEQITKKSSEFPIKFPVDSMRCYQLKEKTSKETLEKNINSAYPVIHEYGLFLCALFLSHQRKFGSKSQFYKDTSLLQLIDRLITKRAVMFLERVDNWMLLSGETGAGKWESVGTTQEQEPLVLETCLSYDEIKLSALLSVSSHTYFINVGDRYNLGTFEEDRGKVEDNGVIIGLIGARLEKPNVMEYREIVISPEQNREENGYGSEEVPTLQNEFLKFYGGPCGTYQQLREELTTRDRYIDFGSRYFDKTMYERRIAISIDTLLLEANHRAHLELKKAYIHVVGLGLGVWKIHEQQNKIFLDTFANRLEVLSDVLTDVSDVRFAHIREKTAGGYKNGDEVKGIRIHFNNRNPHEKLVGEDAGKLLVVSYAWDGNALPGNEFWGGSLSGSGDPAAAASTQVAELHNWYINGKVRAGNLRVATSKGLVTFQEYQQLHQDG